MNRGYVFLVSRGLHVARVQIVRSIARGLLSKLGETARRLRLVVDQSAEESELNFELFQQDVQSTGDDAMNFVFFVLGQDLGLNGGSGETVDVEVGGVERPAERDFRQRGFRRRSGDARGIMLTKNSS